MSASASMPFVSTGEHLAGDIQRWLVTAGIDPNRVLLAAPMQNWELAALYANSDVGLFPSRCEGATNLQLMELMACGRPAIATEFAGHRDLITPMNSFPLRQSQPLVVKRENNWVGQWCDPDLDEILDCLEQAYSDRDRLRAVGQRAAEDMIPWTWERAARRFLDVLEVPER